MDGNFIAEKNDTHGTHVTGTVGANRDGSEFHGVAWGPMSTSETPAERTTPTMVHSKITSTSMQLGRLSRRI